ncbi:MAG: SMP-30/gluconolactonase/LRE family protein [Deltaproteobacteria bacterium]|nr:SMP-30/gluconolactonase/LRE family protein [Deltaproteobacteria bacterium]
MTRLPASLLTSLLLLGACVGAEDELSPDDGFDDSSEDGGGKADGSDVDTVHRFTDRQLFPEGGAFDPTDSSFYVGSLRHGTITKVDALGRETVFYAGGEAGRLTLGMQVDAARRQLWVCTTNNSLGRIWIFDLATGTRSANIDLAPANPEASCNDVLLDTDGTALVSDRENPFIYKIDSARRVSVWATDPLLKGKLVSLNSMAFTPDRSAVLTAPYLQPALIRISVANPRDVRKVALSGDMFMDGFNLLNGPDDLVMHGNQLIVAFGSSIKRITPTDASWTRARVKSTRTIGGVTALVQNGDDLYGINGQSVRFALMVPPAPFQIFEIDTAKLR